MEANISMYRDGNNFHCIAQSRIHRLEWMKTSQHRAVIDVHCANTLIFHSLLSLSQPPSDVLDPYFETLIAFSTKLKHASRFFAH
jgi:hypothetical protein